MAKQTGTRKSRIQVVYSAPLKIFVEKYLSKSIQRRVLNKEFSKKYAMKRYGKNRYRINPEAYPVKVIRH